MPHDMDTSWSLVHKTIHILPTNRWDPHLAELRDRHFAHPQLMNERVQVRRNGNLQAYTQPNAHLSQAFSGRGVCGGWSEHAWDTTQLNKTTRQHSNGLRTLYGEGFI